jgi:hypothetical protein
MSDTTNGSAIPAEDHAAAAEATNAAEARTPIMAARINESWSSWMTSRSSRNT